MSDTRQQLKISLMKQVKLCQVLGQDAARRTLGWAAGSGVGVHRCVVVVSVVVVDVVGHTVASILSQGVSRVRCRCGESVFSPCHLMGHVINKSAPRVLIVIPTPTVARKYPNSPPVFPTLTHQRTSSSHELRRRAVAKLERGETQTEPVYIIAAHPSTPTKNIVG